MLSVFKSRSFTLLWLAQLISSMCSALTTLAASILVFRLTGSTLSVGLMLIATAGPTVLIGLVAGVFVDRLDRKRIMLAADLIRAVFIFLVPLLIPLHIAWLYVIVALTSGITQFFDSAHSSVLPELATDEELAAANALMAISSVGATMFGFAAAGLIASSLPIEWAFYLDALTFALSALLIFFARLPSILMVEDTSVGAILQNLKAGLRTVGQTSILRSLFLVAVPIFFIFGFQNTLLLPFALEVLNGTEFHFGLQQAAEAVGIALGSLLMAKFANRIREGQWLAISYILMAFASLWYSYSTLIGMGIFLIGVSGFVNAPSFIGRQLVIQRSTPREMRGRVNSAFFVVRDSMFVLGMALAGLADLIDIRTLFIVSSYALLFAGLLVLVLPGLRQPMSVWKRMVPALGGAEAAPRLGVGRAATRAEIDRFIQSMPEMTEMDSKERDQLAAETLVAEAPAGRVVIYRGETSDAAYFILKGRAAAGYKGEDEYVILNYLEQGEFFGETAALTGSLRNANVITEEASEFLILPAKVVKRLAGKYPGLREIFYAVMAERVNRIELSLRTSLDQQMLRELRTNMPAEDSRAE
jgi:CRP-like cAMP-binding protein/predicted MFS family arabinose efflux permease